MDIVAFESLLDSSIEKTFAQLQEPLTNNAANIARQFPDLSDLAQLAEALSAVAVSSALMCTREAVKNALLDLFNEGFLISS